MYRTVRDHRAIKFLATKPTMVITTLHPSALVNAGVFGAYTGISPHQVGAAIARDSHTYANILARREFVINVPGADMVASIKVLADDIPADKSEVREAGLTLKEGITVATPGIAECAAAVECVFEQEIAIGEHSFMVGSVTGGWIREAYADADGGIDIFKAQVFKDFKYPLPLYVLPGPVIKG